ncbi:hypothetical protein [Actinomyces minihominis]|uniref:hypothetical protein n=1 Tax=Actinomyces minihominis TaxID=2002838 RepID=UPI00101AD255|nr:hypothetical protein [Actinomyces minihominis]
MVTTRVTTGSIKRRGALPMSVAAGVVLLAACSGGNGSGSACVGTWNMQSLEAGNQSLTAEQLANFKDSDLGFTLIMETDGTAMFHIAGNEAPGTWEPTNDGCSIDIDGDINQASLEGDSLILEMDESTATFTKEP